METALAVAVDSLYDISGFLTTSAQPMLSYIISKASRYEALDFNSTRRALPAAPGTKRTKAI